MIHPSPISIVASTRAPSGVALVRGARDVLPGLALCTVVTGVAFCFEIGETQVFGRAWLETLVLAILIGTAVRTAWTPGLRFQAGLSFGAKQILEIAVALLGLSVSFRTVAAIGPGLLFGIAGVVTLAIPTGYAIGRLLGLPKRLAVLIACGNAICGNSAIAAVAPAIGADGDDVATSIAFTAVLGVLVVLGLPLLAALLHVDQLSFGAFTGLTVYAVPQVLAAATPMGSAAVQIGTLVKLVRVLMLGPVVLILSLLTGRLHGRDEAAGRVAVHRMVPRFILAFLAFATLRSFDLVPGAALAPAATAANALTILSMAALGLGVDVRVVVKAGLRVTGAVTLSLVALGALSAGLILALGLR